MIDVGINSVDDAADKRGTYVEMNNSDFIRVFLSPILEWGKKYYWKFNSSSSYFFLFFCCFIYVLIANLII